MNDIKFQGGKYGLYSNYAYHHSEYYSQYRSESVKLQESEAAR
jgi:hypothetical protein